MLMVTTTLGLSIHRPEMIPFIAQEMRRHEAVFLEEPPDANFDKMLAGTMAVDDYLMPLDLEYPAFSRKMCRLYLELWARGKRIFQVEPYLEILLDVHEFFAAGHRPSDIRQGSARYPVYLAERNATGALLAYYRTAVAGSFEKTLAAVKQFARRDAERFRLRDSLRAQALAPLVRKYPSAYIEAGVIHFPLWRQLRRRLPPSQRVRISFAADSALKTVGRKGHLYGPGDQLTLLNVFHARSAMPAQKTLLAARALIYAKLIGKDEVTDDLDALPHLHDELACIQMTGRLSLADCRHLFPLVRTAGTPQAHQIVGDYLSAS